jgi:hypothetical protein
MCSFERVFLSSETGSSRHRFLESLHLRRYFLRRLRLGRASSRLKRSLSHNGTPGICSCGDTSWWLRLYRHRLWIILLYAISTANVRRRTGGNGVVRNEQIEAPSCLPLQKRRPQQARPIDQDSSAIATASGLSPAGHEILRQGRSLTHRVEFSSEEEAVAPGIARRRDKGAAIEISSSKHRSIKEIAVRP